MSSQLTPFSPLFDQITKNPPGLPRSDLEALRNQLLTFLSDKENSLSQAPEGALTVKQPRRRSTSPEFYYRVGEERQYLGADRKPLATALAQKEYDLKQVREAKRLLKEVERTLTRNLCYHDAYDALSPARRQLVRPDYLPDYLVRQLWDSIQFDSLGFSPNYPEYYTGNGIRVRSHPERSIGNELEKRGILYLYEYPYKMVDGGIVYPDFTCFNLRTRKIFLWEHLGRLDETKYIENNLRKLDRYRASGVRLGIELIVSHDSDRHPFTAADADALITHYLL